MPELVILAAGMGSRYGGLKQIDPVGPHDQTLLDYSIYDALKAGFNRVLFVIRRDIETDFKRFFGSRYEAHVPCTYVNQELDHLPRGFGTPPNRKKPWGTAHALWACESVIEGPFAVINADDFYGGTAYRQMHAFLERSASPQSDTGYAMVSFVLENTISDHGSVSRGICTVDSQEHLVSITERTRIERSGNRIRYMDEGNDWHPLTGKEPTSMNFWGLTPSIFSHLDRRLAAFLCGHQDDPKSEFYLPVVIDHLIHTGQANVTVLASHDRWTGITNPGDKAQVVDHLASLTQQGSYPESLWQ